MSKSAVLSQYQIDVLVVIERSTASISVVSTLILLTTFCLFKQFRSLSNTLIFYASFANLFANVACLMGREYIHDPNGALCQFQAFLLEMFMQSDPLWSCAMAVNVYLCIFRRYDSVQLRRMHWRYALFCYGLPFIPAMFCLFYKDKRGKMYGDATLWCWIDKKYSDVRIYSYYLPIWISIVISLAIYIRVGIVVYRVRADIRALENSGEYTFNDTVTSRKESQTPISTPFNPELEKKTEFDSQTTSSKTRNNSRTIDDEVDGGGISRWDSADITAFHHSPASLHFGHPKLSSHEEESAGFTRHVSYASYVSAARSPLDPVYTHPSQLSRPSISSYSPSLSLSRTNDTTTSHHNHKMDKLKWAYTKSALLFTISILITWIPASINRAQGLTHPHNPSFVLNVMSAIVLPLQGFWNTIIFFVSSWNIVRRGLRRSRRRRRQARKRKQAEVERAGNGVGRVLARGDVV